MAEKRSTLLKNLVAMRIRSHQLIDGLSDEQLLRVPEGLRNNILWNLGHVITDECNMLYEPSGLEFPIPANYKSLFDPETSPADWPSPPPIKEVLAQSRDMTKILIADYKGGKFEHFQPYELAKGYSLDSIEEAIAYHTLHECVHSGVILTIRRLVG